MLVTKKSVPRAPDGRANFRWKKYVSQERGTRPEAKESMLKRRLSFRRVVRDWGEMEGHIDFRIFFGSGAAR